MFKNFVLTTYRNLWKSKGYSFLNIFGLAIGIASAALIFLWVEDEMNFDRFHAKRDRLFMVRENQQYDQNIATFSSTPVLLAPAMQSEIPGIAGTSRIAGWGSVKLMSIGEKSMYASGSYVDASLFSLFSFAFVEGNPKTAFSELYSMVVTESTALKFFGTAKNVAGKKVRVDNQEEFIVTGVIKDIPKNSTISFEWASPFEIWYNKNKSWAQHWGNNCLTTFVELNPGVSESSVNRKLTDFIKKRVDDSNVTPFLWSLSDWRLRDEFENGIQTGGGKIEYVRLFSIIAWVILVIACINFMNLATARSDKRSREVGVRKVLGAGKSSLVIQFIGEAMFMAVLSSVLALLIISIALPAFNLLVQKELSLDIGSPLHVLSLLGITIVCGLLTGSYPSFYLSSFNPVFILKGLKTKSGSAVWIRKGLVILQFTVSIVLIIGTIVIYQQVQHVKGRKLGYNRNNLLQIDMNSEMVKNYSAVQQDLLNTRVVKDVAISDYSPLYGGNNSGGLIWQGKSTKEYILISLRNVSPNFMKTSGMQILSGRDLIHTDSIESKNKNVLITSSLEKLMGRESAIGKTLRWEGDTSGLQFHVVGVVNDYVYGNMYNKPDPVVFFPINKNDATQLYARLEPGSNVEKALEQIGSVIKKNNPSYPFTYHFVDDQFNELFINEQLISKLSRIFATLAIVISCLGLFGLAAYTAERRKKEIGVRKVLGATVSNITALLSKDFLKLVGVACLIAFPLAWWVMYDWLQGYKYRVEISWWIFAAAGILVILIALLTISFQSVRAAIVNPSKNLRTE